MKTHITKGLKIALFSILALSLFAIPLFAHYVSSIEQTQDVFPTPLSTITVQFQDRQSWNYLNRYPGGGSAQRWFLSYTAQGNAITSTMSFTHNGVTTQAFCVQPRIPAPPSGTFQGTVLPNTHPLSHALYWLSGPGSSQFWTADRLAFVPSTDQGCHITSATHLTLSYIYAGRSFSGFSFANLSATGRAGIQQLAAWVDSMPPIPTREMSFSNTHLIAIPYHPNGIGTPRQGLATPWTTFTAPAGVTITMPIQSEATLELNRGGNITTHSGSVTLQNGDGFRFRAVTLPLEYEWDSPQMQSSVPTMGGAVLINQGAGTQTIGSWVGSIQHSQAVSLFVDWFDGYIPDTGSLNIIKTTTNNYGQVAGFRFRVENADTGAFIGIFTSGASGIINIPDLVPGRYRVTEIDISSDFVAPTPNPVYVTIVGGQTASVSFNNVRKQGIITIQKQTTDLAMTVHHMGGAVFVIRDSDGNIVDTLTTDSNGRAQSRVLPLGTYTVQEVTAPYGFTFNPTVFSVTLSGDVGTAAIVYAPIIYVPQQPVVGRIIVQKISTNLTMSSHHMGGAVFGIYNANGERVDTITTEENGYAISRYLPLGEYTIREIAAPYGFLLNTEIFGVTLSFADQYTAVVFETIEVAQQPVVGRIIVEKVCAVTGRRLAGAVFEVRDALGNVVYIITTTANGRGASRELPLGTFTIVEIYAPTGFILNPTPHHVTLTAESQYVAVIHEFLTVENERIRGDIRIIKICSVTDEPLAEATFALYQNGVRIATATTNEYGIAEFLDVLFGEYEIKELYAPHGFVLSDEVVQVSISNNGEVIIIEFVNEPIRGDIRIVKICSVTGRLLANAVFGLYQDGVRIATATTNEYGITEFLDVLFGEFEIREIYAPDGFVLSDEVIEVNISENGAVIEITFANEPYVPYIPEPAPQTGESGFIVLGLVIIGIVPLAIVAMFKGNKRDKL